MIIKFKAYAVINDENDKWKRIAETIHNTEEEAKKAAANFAEAYKGSKTGIHKYYIITRKEWENEHYKDVSLNGKTKTWMINEGNGCVLLLEGVHFEIVDTMKL